MRTIQVLLASRLRVIGASICLLFLCSCISISLYDQWYGDASVRPDIPPEVSFDKKAGRGDYIYVTLRLEGDEDLLFLVDTGAPVSVLDKTLEPRLGERVGTIDGSYPYSRRRVRQGAYRAPRLYLGNTQLLAGKWVATDDLSATEPHRPLRGILGMDCLRHYCLQLDFAANKMRFLDPARPGTKDLGKAFPLTFSSGPLHVFVDDKLLGVRGANSLIDTGDSSDGALESTLQEAWEEPKAVWTNHVTTAEGAREHRAFFVFPKGEFGGDTYPFLILTPDFRNIIGLRFLARHLVTFNFPKRTMHLLRRSD